MFWADRVVAEIEDRFAERIKAGEKLIVRDEKTASGRVHIGSMRGVAIHGMVADELNARGVPATFLYEINDFDPMDGLPTYLDETVYGPEMGKILKEIPSPESSAPNFAEFYGREFEEVIVSSGFHPEFTRASDLYLSGKMNDVIKEALDGAGEIRRIYKEVSGSEKPDDWFPLSVRCEECGRIGTTQVSAWDGEKVTYACKEDVVTWAKGCGHNGSVSPFDGNAKLPWKVEWPAKWKVVGVDIEGAGKDHSTKGGARDVANHISKEVFTYEPPYDIPYEFFLVGGQKMSSSKGRGSSAADVAKLIPTKILRLALLGTQPKRAIDLDPAGDTIPVWFDWYDKIAEKFWSGVGDDDARLFELVHEGNPPEAQYLARFSSVAFLVQMEHLNLVDEVSKMKEGDLTEAEREELAERAEYARAWLSNYAPERYRFELARDAAPEAVQSFSDLQREALRDVLSYVEANEGSDGQAFHTALHEIRQKHDIMPNEFFGALYQTFLGKDHGPKAGWFLSVLDRDFLISRLREVVGSA